MTEQIHDSSELLALVKQECGESMPKIMKTHPFQPCRRPRRAESPVDIPRFQRRAELGGEHQAVVLPGRADQQSVLGLTHPLSRQRGHCELGQRHRPSRPMSLWRDETQFAVDPLHASAERTASGQENRHLASGGRAPRRGEGQSRGPRRRPPPGDLPSAGGEVLMPSVGVSARRSFLVSVAERTAFATLRGLGPSARRPREHFATRRES